MYAGIRIKIIIKEKVLKRHLKKFLYDTYCGMTFETGKKIIEIKDLPKYKGKNICNECLRIALYETYLRRKS